MLVDASAEINSISDHVEYMALPAAAIYGQLDIVGYLIDNKADVNGRDRTGTTALMVATSAGQIPVLECLIESKANVNQKNQKGETALMYVRSNDRSQRIIQLLVDHGADINYIIRGNARTSSYFSYTPLIYAVRYGGDNLELVAGFVTNKADLTSVDQDGDTVMVIATKLGHVNVMKYLMHKTDASDVRTAFMAAASLVYLLPIECLLDNFGIDVDEADPDGLTPLIAAAANKTDDDYSHFTLPTIKTLIQHQANVNKPDRSGRTALMAAVSSGRLRVVEYLLDKKADVNQADSSGRTALMAVGSSGRLMGRLGQLIRMNCVLKYYSQWRCLRSQRQR
jgi:ankyrin repeat protein